MKRSILIVLGVALATVSFVLGTPGIAAAGVTELVSVGSGAQSNGESTLCSVSSDGRYVAFESVASNLVDGDKNGYADIFVRDVWTGRTKRVSVDSAGNEANNGSFHPSISADGRYVAFQSYASNLAVDSNGYPDIFVHDVQTGATILVSRRTDGKLAKGGSYWPSISGNGGFVAFTSTAADMVESDTNSKEDVFVHDLKSAATTRVSVGFMGSQANDESLHPSLSRDGRYVAFDSRATGLASGDTDSTEDVFVHDRTSGTTTLLSKSTGGVKGNGPSRYPAISGDGNWIAFESFASNLVAGDNNTKGDIFVRNPLSGATSRVSLTSSGAEVNGDSVRPSISYAGGYIAFASLATNMVTGDLNNHADVFVRARSAGTTTRFSVSGAGAEANGTSWYPCISPDANWVGFQSAATNLLATVDSNGKADIFTATKVPAPTVTGLSPNVGSMAGGNSVVITGTNFVGVRSVAFGGTPCASLTLNSPTKITATAPGHSVGIVDVRVSAAGGVSGTTGSGNDYSYLLHKEQTDSDLAYSGTWAKTFAATGASGGTYARANISAASVVIPFNGTRLDWIGAKGPNQGKADVSVDGKAPVTIDLYRAAGGLFQQRLYTTGILGSGYHWMKISWYGSNPAGKYINVDAAEVAGTLLAAALAEEKDGRLIYAPAWTNGTSGVATGGTYRYTSTYGAQVTVNFTGVSIEVLARKDSDYGKLALILDGGAPIFVDLYSATAGFARVWFSGFLTPGDHTLVIKRSVQHNSLSTGYTIGLDGLLVRGVLR